MPTPSSRPPLHAHTQFKATSVCQHSVQGHLCMPTPTSKPPLHTHLCMPTPSSRPPLHAHTQFKATSACLHPVEGHLCMPTPSSRPPLHAHTQFKATSVCQHSVQGHLCMPTPTSRPPLHANIQTVQARPPQYACPHPVQDCQTPPLHSNTQFKAVHPNLFMPTPSSRLLNPCNLCIPTPSSRPPRALYVHTQFKPTSACPHPVQGYLCMPTSSSSIDTPHEGGIGNDKICERILKHSALSTWGQ